MRARAYFSRFGDAGRGGAAPTGLLQRQCACGTADSGTCTQCRRKDIGLQRKLAVGSTNDPLEHEADRVADAIVAAPTRPVGSTAVPYVQRRSQTVPSSGTADAPSSVERTLASPGAPLPRALRSDMEHAFGHDFSRVRVHTGIAAEQSAREVDALAYTVGTSIVFGAGGYAQGSARGRRLLGHELAHVVQQSSTPSSGATVSMLRRQGAGAATPARSCTLEVCWASIGAYHLGAAGQVHGVINVDTGPGVHHLEVDPSQHQARGSWHSHVVDVPGRRGGAPCSTLPATCAQAAAIASAAREYESRDAIYDPLTVTGPNSNSFVEWVLDRAGIATSTVAVPRGATGWGYYLIHPPQRTDPPHVARSDPGRTPAPAPRAFGGSRCGATYAPQRTAVGYIALIRAAAAKLAAAGISNISDQIKILRGMYYGTPWSRDFGKEQSLSRVAGFQLFTLSGVEYPRDPVSILDCGLYDAIQRSQDVSVRGVTVDVGHLLIGLDARSATVAGRPVPNAPMPGFGGSGLDVVTWLGDLGGGAASLARDRAMRSPTTPVSSKFSGVDYGGPSNLEGDVAAYIVGRGGATSVVRPVVPPGADLADLLDAYLSPATTGGSADWQSRASTFLGMFGGTFSASGSLSNEPAMISGFAGQIESFACAYVRQRYVSTLSETQLLATCDHVRSCSHEVAETLVHALVDATTSGQIRATRFPSPGGPTPGACPLITAPIRARRAAEEGVRRGQELWERAQREWEAL